MLETRSENELEYQQYAAGFGTVLEQYRAEVTRLLHSDPVPTKIVSEIKQPSSLMLALMRRI